jgi:hypothetical protein
VKEAAIALMNNCSKTLLKTVNVGPVLQLLITATEQEITSYLVLQEEAFKHKQSQTFAVRKRVTA